MAVTELQAIKSEILDGIQIDWDVPVEMDDGLILRADVFRPVEERQYPVILTYGPYAKFLSFQEGYPDQWRIMCEEHPDVPADSTNKHQAWEVVDPEKWVPYGYVCVRVDSRGAGRSPGYIQHFSPRETKDFYDCIEWAGTQSWSNGKVGLNGISYYAMNQWAVAALKPPHLAAICPWEGAADWYRDSTHHGGIHTPWWGKWYENQVKNVQYGLGDRGRKHVVTGLNVSGEENLSDEELERNRVDFGEEIRSHPLIDDYFKERIPDFSKIDVPLLSSGNWGGHGLHLRGNTEGYVRCASKQKWLELHGLEHWTHFYTDYGRELQLRFFDHFLKGEDNGWDKEPPVLLNVRHVDGTFVLRKENEWPISRTQWTKLYLDPAGRTLSLDPVDREEAIAYKALTESVTFSMVLDRELEITGPAASKLFVSSSTEDADIFLVVRVFDPDGKEVTFQGALDPHSPIAHGWLRASHRKLDPVVSTEFRPFHSHDERQALTPGQVYELDVEIWPTCLVIPAGYTLALTVQGKDYHYGGEEINVGWFTMTGVGPFTHDEPAERPPEVFGGDVTLHAGRGRPAYLLLPIVPAS
jgi:predicted acyl esterase